MGTLTDGKPVNRPGEQWHHARLIPTYGVRSQEEQEKRATSCLLAVMHGVPEFAHALLKDLGAPKAPNVETFAEVRFKDVDGKTVIPDGAIRCERGSKLWTCLVEVKTGGNALKDEQVGKYLDLARDRELDGVLTISNQITHDASESPVCVDGRKLKRANLWHLSWWRILTEAVVQSRYRGVSDPDQAWVLRELIHYLSSDVSGVGDFGDMGEHWVTVRKAAHERTLRQGDPAVRHVAERWEQFTQYLCLSLSQELGHDVVAPRPRKQTTSGRLDEVSKALAVEGSLEAIVRIPNAVGDMHLSVDLRSRQTSVSVEVAAPHDGRPKSRINWLLRQLGEASPDLRVEVWYPHARDSVATTLQQAREQPESLLCPADPKREPRSFELTLTRPVGQKRGRAEGSFVRETRTQAVSFYRDLVQNLKAWQAPAPQLRPQPELIDTPPISAPDLLPLLPADHMLPRPAVDAPTDRGISVEEASPVEPERSREESVQDPVSMSAPYGTTPVNDPRG
jgi:hypothetical protein